MKPVQNEKWLHISEEIVPLTRDEAGMLKGGFTEVDLPEDIMPFALSNPDVKIPAIAQIQQIRIFVQTQVIVDVVAGTGRIRDVTSMVYRVEINI